MGGALGCGLRRSNLDSHTGEPPASPGGRWLQPPARQAPRRRHRIRVAGGLASHDLDPQASAPPPGDSCHRADEDRIFQDGVVGSADHSYHHLVLADALCASYGAPWNRLFGVQLSRDEWLGPTLDLKEDRAFTLQNMGGLKAISLARRPRGSPRKLTPQGEHGGALLAPTQSLD